MSKSNVIMSDKKTNTPNKKDDGWINKIKNIFNGIFGTFFIKSMIIAFISLLLFFMSIILLPKFLDNESNARIKTYKVHHVNSNYFKEYPMISDFIYSTCVEIMKNWTNISDANISFNHSDNASESSLSSIASNSKNKFILTNSESLSTDILQYYSSSFNIIETGDMLLCNNQNFKKEKNVIEIITNLDTRTKVGVFANCHSGTWDKILSCNFITYIYDDIEKLINDLEDNAIDYAIAPRLYSEQYMDIISVAKKLNIEIYDTPVTSAGPILLVSKDIKDHNKIIASFNKFLININSNEHKILMPLSYDYSIPVFPEKYMPNDSFL